MGVHSPPATVVDGAALGRRLLARDLAAAPAALNVLEDRSPAGRGTRSALLAATAPAESGAEAPGHLVGLTGPPGAGKSSLLSALLGAWRGQGRSVAVLAIDPSSRRSGGSLLGDRARIEHDERDSEVLIRSTASGGRLGGLAAATRESALVLALAYDVVVVETVGVGQSETDVAELCDTVVVVVQPGAGDTLQFLKAGLMEVPDVLVVAKADLGRPAQRAHDELSGALGVLEAADTPVLLTSAILPTRGIHELVQALDAHRQGLDLARVRSRARQLAALSEWVVEHGEAGLRRLGGRRRALSNLAAQDPWLDVAALGALLEESSTP